MKMSIWDILSIVVLVAILGLGIIFLQVFINPTTPLNLFPPPTLPPTVMIPTSTATLLQMPSTWTPTPTETPVGFAMTMTAGTPVPITETSGTPGTPAAFPTFTPSKTATPTATMTKTRSSTSSGSGVVTSTKAATSASGTKAATSTATAPANVKSATEKSGTRANVWQKTNNRPTFVWNVTPDMFQFFWYFGLNPTGTSDAGVQIRHDSKIVEFTPPAVPTCGVYYFRVKTRYGMPAKPGQVAKYQDSLWTTLFVFKYDNTPPVAPYYADMGIKGARRGIQNISGDPSFNWSWIDGSDAVNGDYIVIDYDDDGEDEYYMCGGVKGYYVYWGPDSNGVDKSTFVKTAKYNPKVVLPNTPYYLRIQTVDVLDNISEWRTVAMDEEYDPAGGLPTVEEAIFYYDNVKPNNITGVVAQDSDGNALVNDGPFTNDREPTFTFVGGDDPVGFRTDELWGYRVIWSTKPDSTPVFQRGNVFSKRVSTSGTYFLRVQAVDWAGNGSTDYYTFVFHYDNVGPSGVKTVQEFNGVPNNKFTTTMNDASFAWTPGVTDPGTAGISSSGALQDYWVYWGDDPAAPEGDFVQQSDAFFDPPAMPPGIYYLRIMTRDNAGNATITTPFTLKFDDAPPTNPDSVVEVGGSKDGVPQKRVKSPSFRWSGARDVGSGIAGYYVYFGTDPGGESTKLTTKTSYTGKASAGTYYLRVQTKDNAGNLSGWSTIFTFIYDPTLP